MAEEDKIKIKSITEKIDKKALAGAIGLMLMSWTALPVVYWLILKTRKTVKVQKEEEKENDENRN